MLVFEWFVAMSRDSKTCIVRLQHVELLKTFSMKLFNQRVAKLKKKTFVLSNCRYCFFSLFLFGDYSNFSVAVADDWLSRNPRNVSRIISMALYTSASTAGVLVMSRNQI